MRTSKLFLIGIFLLLLVNLVSASRLPTVGGDEDDWGNVLNDFLSKIAGSDGIKLNKTMVNGTNIYSSSINTTHIKDGTLTANDLSDDSVNSSKIDLTEVTISKFTNDANYLSKDGGGTIDGSLIVNGNFTLIGSYLNATVTNQYLNGSFLPEITNLFDIGSSLLKWANLYVTNIYASKIYSDDWSNVTIQESQITDLQSYLTGESDPLYSAWDKDYGDLINIPTIPTLWDSTFNDTGDARWSGGTDTQKSSDGNYLYNDTSTIYFNETKLNDTIDNKISGVAGDNSSWNESYADTLYAGIEWDYNQTIPANLYTDSVNTSTASWIESVFAKIVEVFTKSEIQTQYYNKSDVYNKTEVDEAIPNVDNFYTKSEVDTNLSYYLLLTDQRFNETSYVDELIANYYNKTDVYNKTEVDDLVPDLSDFYTKAEVDNNLTLYLLLTDQRFNETDLINSLISSVNTTTNIQALGFYTSDEVDSLVTNLNETDLVLNVNSTLWNYITTNEASWLSSYNSTYDTWAYNQTIPAQAYADAQDVIFNDSMKDYIDAQIAGVDEGNSSFNQSLTDTLYMNINQDDWIDDGEESDLNVNSSDYWDNLGTINETQMENNGGVLNILESWLSELFDSLFGAKTTDDLIEGSTRFYDNRSWNQSLADTLYAPISVTGDNSSWNESYADTLYAGIEWDYNQSTPVFDYITSQEDNWLLTYNATYDTWAYNQTTPANSYTDTQINSINTTENIDSLGFLNKSGSNANQNINISPYNITATYVKLGGGGYMYDNGTTLILGRD